MHECLHVCLYMCIQVYMYMEAPQMGMYMFTYAGAHACGGPTLTFGVFFDSCH